MTAKTGSVLLKAMVTLNGCTILCMLSGSSGTRGELTRTTSCPSNITATARMWTKAYRHTNLEFNANFGTHCKRVGGAIIATLKSKIPLSVRIWL